MPRDLLDDLRDADPVDRDALEVPAPLAARVLGAGAGDGVAACGPRRRRRRPRLARLVPAVGVAVAAVAGVALVVSGGRSPDLAARAYAAASGKGIVHWRVDIAGYGPNGKVGSRQRTEGWKLGSIRHVLHSDVAGGKAHVTADTRVVGRRSRAWLSGSDDYTSFTLPKQKPTSAEDAVFRDGDPLVAFRQAYREGKLRDLGGGRFDVVFRHLPAGSVVYEVDPRSGRPRRLVVANADGSKSIMSFSVYETLPDTPANHAKLLLLPHPGAGPGTERPTDHFKALREGAPLAGPYAKMVRGLASNMGKRFGVDVDGVRVLTKNVWLLPGKGYICIAQASRPSGSPSLVSKLGIGVGGTCVTMRKALQQGISTGSPSGGVVVAVPDEYSAIEARYRWHGPWKRYPATDGVARLPGLGYQVRLAR